MFAVTGLAVKCFPGGEAGEAEQMDYGAGMGEDEDAAVGQCQDFGYEFGDTAILVLEGFSTRRPDVLPVVVPGLESRVGDRVIALHFPLSEVHLAQARIDDVSVESAGTGQKGAPGEGTAVNGVEFGAEADKGLANSARLVGEGRSHTDIGAAVAGAGLNGDSCMANGYYLEHRAKAVMQNESSERRAVAPQQSPV